MQNLQHLKSLSRVYTNDDGSRLAGRVYFFMEAESQIEPIVALLRSSESEEGGVLFGLGGILNLHLLAAGRLEGGILTDINDNQQRMWDIFFALMEDIRQEIEAGAVPYEDRRRYTVERLCALPEMCSAQNPDITFIAPERFAEFLWREYENPAGFLGSDAALDHIFALNKAGALVAITLDARDVEGHARLADQLEEDFLAVDVINRLNLGHFLRESGKFSGNTKQAGMDDAFLRLWESHSALAHEETLAVGADALRRVQRISDGEFVGGWSLGCGLFPLVMAASLKSYRREQKAQASREP